jgi:Polyketide cyclase / dehydrase and lipid transport
MKVVHVTVAALALTTAIAASAANAAEVRQVAEIKASPATVWAKIGDWCAIKNWHPAIANCEASKKAGETFRTLTLKDGGKIVEKMTKTGKTSYSYDIIDGPLPVKNYSATLAAKADSLGTTDLVWTAKFDPKGKTDAEAAAVINGIFEAGLKSIKEMKFDSIADKAAGAAATATAAVGAAAAAMTDKAKDAVAAVKDAAKPAATTPATTTPAVKDAAKDAAATAAAAKEAARVKARAERAQRIESAKVAAMEKYAKFKADAAEKAKAASEAAKAAYEKAKAALTAMMAPKPVEAPKKP